MPNKKPQLDSLTGLRWFAALAVFTRHVGSHVYQVPLFSVGASGVSLFFILSGFVLTYSDKPNDTARAFYKKRFARIYPAFLASAVLTGLLATNEFGSLTSLPAVLSLTQAWVPVRPIYFGVSGVLWSLSCEAFFYLCLPVLLPAVSRLSRHRRRLLLALCFLVAIGWPLLVRSPWNEGTGYWLIYIFPIARLPEFVIGVLLALELRDGVRLPVRLSWALVLTVGCLVGAAFAPVYLRWVACTVLPYSLLIYVAAQTDVDGAKSWLRRKPLVLLGRWSFCFYLLHSTVLVALHLPPGSVPKELLLCFAFALPVATLAAAALHYAVEVPWERRLRPSSS